MAPRRDPLRTCTRVHTQLCSRACSRVAGRPAAAGLIAASPRQGQGPAPGGTAAGPGGGAASADGQAGCVHAAVRGEAGGAGVGLRGSGAGFPGPPDGCLAEPLNLSVPGFHPWKVGAILAPPPLAVVRLVRGMQGAADESLLASWSSRLSAWAGGSGPGRPACPLPWRPEPTVSGTGGRCCVRGCDTREGPAAPASRSDAVHSLPQPALPLTAQGPPFSAGGGA